MKLRIKNTDVTLKIISGLQIIGGIAGIGVMMYIMLRITDAINGAVLLLILVGLALFIYSIYAGKRLLTDSSKQSAIVYSLINYSLQVIQWSLFGYAFTYCSGFQFTIGSGGLTFTINLGTLVSDYKMSINSSGDSFFRINVLAILIIVILADALKELNVKKEEPILLAEKPVNPPIDLQSPGG